MSIPALKRQFNMNRGIITARTRSTRADTPGPSQPDGPRQPKQGSRVKPLGAVAALLLIATIAYMPVADATAVCNGKNGTEDFETYQVGVPPAFPATSTCLYSWATPVGSGYVVSSPVFQGTRAFFTNSQTSGQFTVPNPCHSNNGGNTATYNFDFRFAGPLPPVNEYLTIGYFPGGIALALAIDSNGIPGALRRDNQGAGQINAFTPAPGATAISLNTWYHGTMTHDDKSGIVGATSGDCVGQPVSPFAPPVLVVTVSGTGYGPFTAVGEGTQNADNAITFNWGSWRTQIQVNGAPLGTPAYIDNFQISGYPGEGNAGYRFCAEPTEANFGYNYVEGVVFSDFSGGDGFVFEGDEDNSDYLGKGFNTGSKGFFVKARIIAAAEGQKSEFFAAFTTGAGGLPSSTTKAAEVDKLDGIDGGNFDNSIQVVFDEDGGDWVIRIFQNVGGNRDQIGSSVRHGSPNVDYTYNFTVNTDSTFIGVYGEEGELILSRNVPAGLQNAVLKDQWFVGKGDGLTINSFTRLDDNTDSDENDDSTCIYDLFGTSVVNGSDGSTPGSQVPDTNNGGGGGGGGSTGTEELLDSPYFWVLIWILFVTVAIAAISWATRAGFGGMVYGIAAMIVYIFGILFYGTDAVSPWPIVAIISFVIGMAIWAGVRR